MIENDLFAVKQSNNKSGFLRGMLKYITLL